MKTTTNKPKSGEMTKRSNNFGNDDTKTSNLHK